MDWLGDMDGVQAAAAIYGPLIGTRLSEKYRAVELLDRHREDVDLQTLRMFLIKAINEDFYAGKELEQEDHSIAQTRMWLLGALARIATGNDAATKLAIRHLDEGVEGYAWGRYWALEGLISGANPEAESAAKAASKDLDLLVSMLAHAYLASRGDKSSMDEIKNALHSRATLWPALRALRVVPLPATVPTICKIVEKGDHSDETYDAIMALGSVPSDWSQAPRSAQVLAGAILSMRGSPWKDSTRTGAIAGLGNLAAESATPLLIEELVDDNPAIVREAARSTEKILGVRTMVFRVVEAAARSGAARIDDYARGLRWLDRAAVANELEALMVSGPARHQDVARALLSEVGGAVAFEKLRARSDSMRQYYEVLEAAEGKIRTLFESSVDEARRGFHYAVIMDVVVFATGIALLLGSAAYALLQTGGIEKWAGVGVSGGAGVLGVVYGVLIANPRKQVRESVDHLMHIKMVFLAYLRRLHQSDQAYTRRLLDDEPMTVDEVEEFSAVVGRILKETTRDAAADSPAEAGLQSDPKEEPG